MNAHNEIGTSWGKKGREIETLRSDIKKDQEKSTSEPALGIVILSALITD